MIPLECENFYHVFNRANGSEVLFYTPENRRFFLQQYRRFLGNFVETHCYCLMTNHFHMLIEVKSHSDIVSYLSASNVRKSDLGKFVDSPDAFLSKQFSNFFSSYTQSLNKQQSRMGSLFMRGFKRSKITSDVHRINVVNYIHNNPVEAGLCNKPGDWPYSSYVEILSAGDDNNNYNPVIEWFGDRSNFIAFHERRVALDDEAFPE